MLQNKKAKYVPSLNKKEEDRKRAIVEKRKSTINKKKRAEFVEMLYKKYE